MQVTIFKIKDAQTKRSRMIIRTCLLVGFLISPASLSTLTAQGLNYVQIEKAPPYESRLLRLSEVIGSIHFLTLLCTPEDGTVWHDKMNEMLDVEAKTQLRRAKLIERFNFGFNSFQSTYRNCTASANTALARYTLEAKTIVQNLTRNFSE